MQNSSRGAGRRLRTGGPAEPVPHRVVRLGLVSSASGGYAAQYYRFYRVLVGGWWGGGCGGRHDHEGFTPLSGGKSLRDHGGIPRRGMWRGCWLVCPWIKRAARTAAAARCCRQLIATHVVYWSPSTNHDKPGHRNAVAVHNKCVATDVAGHFGRAAGWGGRPEARGGATARPGAREGAVARPGARGIRGESAGRRQM
jgi:hypothetical protein